MLQVDDQFEVAAPRSEVFRAWTEFERFPEFMTGVDSVYAETKERMRWRVSIAGVERTFYAVVTECRPDERIAWMSVDQTTMGWWIDLDAVDDDRTRVTLRVTWSPRGDGPSGPDLHDLDERTIRCDLQRFRACAEQPLSRAA
ncbi:SRPBCC family protein [Agrococcus sp. ProA11]|uniref:SRPBCC family protein n=1 Tax=Agrococcus chionoecetis TaxID=3153752 RepID=UPI00326044E2